MLLARLMGSVSVTSMVALLGVWHVIVALASDTAVRHRTAYVITEKKGSSAYLRVASSPCGALARSTRREANDIALTATRSVAHRGPF